MLSTEVDGSIESILKLPQIVQCKMRYSSSFSTALSLDLSIRTFFYARRKSALLPANMPKKVTAEQNVSLWVAEIVEREKFKEHRIQIENEGGLGGHLGNIICANIVGTTTDNQNKEVCIVVKYNSSESDFLKLAFEHEIFIYDKLFPIIRKFQLDKNVSEIFCSMPKCYQTISSNDQAAIILENLGKRGYRLYNSLKPMDLPHQKLVLGEYAKLHAVSFALRDQNYEEFEKVSQNLPNVAKFYFQEDSTRKAMMKYTRYARDIMVRKNETELIEKLDWILETGPTKIILNEVLNAAVDDCVVTHGDSWNNNFMFMYKENELQPSQLAIIDWQLSSMHSPVLDLSLFIYTVSSEEELFHAEELITFYYSVFSNYLRELGSDPEKLFPFSKLKEHWYKYSIFPMVWIVSFLRIILEEECKESKEDMFDNSINEEEYERRMIAVMKHHFSFKFEK